MMTEKAKRTIRIGPLKLMLRRGKDERQTSAEVHSFADMIRDAADG